MQGLVKFGTGTLTGGKGRSRWRPGGRDSRGQSGPFVARSEQDGRTFLQRSTGGGGRVAVVLHALEQRRRAHVVVVAVAFSPRYFWPPKTMRSVVSSGAEARFEFPDASFSLLLLSSCFYHDRPGSGRNERPTYGIVPSV